MQCLESVIRKKIFRDPWDRPTRLVPLGRSSLGASTLGTDQLDWFPWDEAVLEHRHLGQTNQIGSLGTKLSQSIDTWDRLTRLVPLGRSSLGASTLGTDQLDWFPWDEALSEHRHLGQTNQTGSLGTKLSQSIDTWDRPTRLVPLGRSSLRASTLGTDARLVPLGRSSLRASTLGTD